MLNDIRAIIQACNELVVALDRHPIGAICFLAISAILLAASIVWIT